MNICVHRKANVFSHLISRTKLILYDFDVNCDFIRFEDGDINISKKNSYLDAEYFCGHPELLLRTDLVNLHVYICAPEVLLLFSDNFDYQVRQQHPQDICLAPFVVFICLSDYCMLMDMYSLLPVPRSAHCLWCDRK